MRLAEASILIVDDEPVVCEIMGAWLTRAGCRVQTAANGAEALEFLAANRVDVVISDLQMPVMDGITLLKRIHAGGQRPAFIFITGYCLIALRDVYDVGAEALLEKPFEREQFLEAIRHSLMDRDTLWRVPLDPAPQVVLRAVFDSLDAALRDQKIAFGRGGFCLESAQALNEGPVGFRIEFTEDRRCLQGQGIVRWVSPSEKQAGIEFMYLDDPGRQWVIELTAQSNQPEFIPRSTATARVAAKAG